MPFEGLVSCRIYLFHNPSLFMVLKFIHIHSTIEDSQLDAEVLTRGQHVEICFLFQSEEAAVGCSLCRLGASETVARDPKWGRVEEFGGSVGIVLITVSGIAWRLTSHDAPSCRAMLGLQNSEQEPNRRFVPRVPPYGRPHHPYAAMMYPEFQYRPPPPSYQASMQEYRLRLLLLDRQQGSGSASNTASALSPVSPPPTYRSHNTGTLHSRPPLTLTDREYSRPPSYRSRASSAGVLRPSTETLCSLSTQQQSPQQPQPQLQPVPATSHSRNPSLSLSFLSHESLFLDSGHSRPAAAQDPVHFTSPSGDSVVGGLSDDSRDGGSSTWDRGGGPWKPLPHDVNAVTIVQTTDSSQVLNRDTASVILSVPGREVPQMNGGSAGEVRILAHV
ncbi:hypothetical protein AVEN_136931-1 [Araneus ventricosus]|uniref:Uncharacterized protein n=1 Tax=Araneus ventricosus TaxID=182803 RepID=A0A4Y2BGP2_ARAVE|nr:hypothetical protein AVEN_136931-1 [Araneus ventricosus]